MHSRRLLTTTRWLLAFGALAGIVTLYRYWVHVNPTTVALTLVLYVLIIAAQWELRYAVAVAFVATGVYNFFFLPPVGTFTISDPQNWIALFAFLGTSVVGSRLSQKARMEAATSRSKQRELEVLYGLSRDLLQTDSLATAVHSIPALINTYTSAESVILYLLDGDRLYQAGIHAVSGVELPQLHQLAINLPSLETVPGNEVRIPLHAGARPRGLLVLRGVKLAQENLEAIGGLVSITLDRAQAMEHIARNEANKESERLRTLILDSITHELRTPLTSIKAAAGALLASEDMSSQDRQELISVVDEEADRLNRLVGQAVEMAQIETREVQMHFEDVSVAELVQQARLDCAWVEASHPLHVDVPESAIVIADRAMIGKVLCNLLENAAKYSAAGTPIFVTAEPKNRFVLTSIADRGIGIDKAEQDLVFERLYRARSHTEKVSGTGMGLAISRAIIDAHQGEISLTSQVGSGSVFTFALPMSTHVGMPGSSPVSQFARGGQSTEKGTIA